MVKFASLNWQISVASMTTAMPYIHGTTLHPVTLTNCVDTQWFCLDWHLKLGDLLLFLNYIKSCAIKHTNSYLNTIVKDLLPDHVALIGGFYNVKEPEVILEAYVRDTGLKVLHARFSWGWSPLPLNIVGFQFAVIFAKALLVHKSLNVRVWFPKGCKK